MSDQRSAVSLNRAPRASELRRQRKHRPECVVFLGPRMAQTRAPAAPAPVIRQDERAKRVGLQVRARGIGASMHGTGNNGASRVKTDAARRAAQQASCK